MGCGKKAAYDDEMEEQYLRDQAKLQRRVEALKDTSPASVVNRLDSATLCLKEFEQTKPTLSREQWKIFDMLKEHLATITPP